MKFEEIKDIYNENDFDFCDSCAFFVDKSKDDIIYCLFQNDDVIVMNKEDFDWNNDDYIGEDVDTKELNGDYEFWSGLRVFSIGELPVKLKVVDKILRDQEEIVDFREKGEIYIDLGKDFPIIQMLSSAYIRRINKKQRFYELEEFDEKRCVFLSGTYKGRRNLEVAKEKIKEWGIYVDWKDVDKSNGENL